MTTPDERTKLRREGPMCRFCRKAVNWRNIKTDDRKIGRRVYERVYWCPHCRAVLEYASWQAKA